MKKHSYIYLMLSILFVFIFIILWKKTNFYIQIKDIITGTKEDQNKVDKIEKKSYLITKKEHLLPEEKEIFKLAIIIDDIGFSIEPVYSLLEIKEPITFSILPFQRYSEKVANLLKENNKEIMLHLPMESNNFKGDSENDNGTILMSMDEFEISNLVEKAINSIPYTKGVNNHKGSKITENENSMRIILRVIKEKNLFFIDSKTSSYSIANQIAVEMGIPSLSSDLFIDNIQTEDHIKSQIFKVVEIAKKKKKAIGIGHPYETTINVLKEILPKIKDYGITLIFVSDLLK
ncbi:MAG: divergent polysaccharide deacetylase family protein [Acidobacteriota bacterium]